METPLQELTREQIMELRRVFSSDGDFFDKDESIALCDMALAALGSKAEGMREMCIAECAKLEEVWNGEWRAYRERTPKEIVSAIRSLQAAALPDSPETPATPAHCDECAPEFACWSSDDDCHKRTPGWYASEDIPERRKGIASRSLWGRTERRTPAAGAPSTQGDPRWEQMREACAQMCDATAESLAKLAEHALCEFNYQTAATYKAEASGAVYCADRIRALPAPPSAVSPIQDGAQQAHLALLAVRCIAAEAFMEWDRDNDSRVGKILGALAGKRGYRADIDAIIDATDALPAPLATTGT